MISTHRLPSIVNYCFTVTENFAARMRTKLHTGTTIHPTGTHAQAPEGRRERTKDVHHLFRGAKYRFWCHLGHSGNLECPYV